MAGEGHLKVAMTSLVAELRTHGGEQILLGKVYVCVLASVCHLNEAEGGGTSQSRGGGGWEKNTWSSLRVQISNQLALNNYI